MKSADSLCAHATPELAKSAGIALVYADSDAIPSELTPPSKCLDRRDA
jgi:hypothetical protein